MFNAAAIVSLSQINFGVCVGNLVLCFFITFKENSVCFAPGTWETVEQQCPSQSSQAPCLHHDMFWSGCLLSLGIRNTPPVEHARVLAITFINPTGLNCPHPSRLMAGMFLKANAVHPYGARVMPASRLAARQVPLGAEQAGFSPCGTLLWYCEMSACKLVRSFWQCVDQKWAPTSLSGLTAESFPAWGKLSLWAAASACSGASAALQVWLCARDARSPRLGACSVFTEIGSKQKRGEGLHALSKRALFSLVIYFS